MSQIPQDKFFDYKLPPGSTTWPAQTVLDGCSELGFKANTLYIGCGKAVPSLPPVLASGGPPNPVITWRFIGTHKGGSYVRDFALKEGDCIELDISAFCDCRVLVTACGYALAKFSDVQPYVVVTNRVVAGRERPWVTLPLRLTPGTYAVPAGATKLYVGTADGGFAWSGADRAAAAVAMPFAVNPGAELDVAGQYLTVTANPFQCFFRIQL